MPAGTLKRAWRHALAAATGRLEPVAARDIDALERVVTEGERHHTAEIRVVIERALPPLAVLRRGLTARERALQLFAELHVWDTEADNGVLVYLCHADRQVEILADRAAARRIPQAVWDDACATIARACAAGRAGDGLVQALGHLGTELAKAFPAGDTVNPNELRDRPLVR